MRLLLHIGAPKTGSTSIQAAFEAGSDALAAAGIAYFPGERLYSTLYQQFDTLPPPLAARFASPREAEAWSEEQWQAFERQVAETRPALALMSSEHFLELKRLPAFLDRLGTMFDRIDAVAYIRDPVASYVSMVNQRIRGGLRLRRLFSAWNRANPMWQADALLRWEAGIGRDALHVRNFDRTNLHGGDVAVDVFHRLSEISGVSLAAPDQPETTNESLSGAATAFLLLLNESQPDWLPLPARKAAFEARQTLIEQLAAVDARLSPPPLKLRDPQITDYLRHVTREKSLLVNDRFLQGQVQLPVGPPLEVEPDAVTMRDRARDWIISYLTPELLQEIARETMRLRPPGEAD